MLQTRRADRDKKERGRSDLIQGFANCASRKGAAKVPRSLAQRTRAATRAPAMQGPPPCVCTLGRLPGSSACTPPVFERPAHRAMHVSTRPSYSTWPARPVAPPPGRGAARRLMEQPRARRGRAGRGGSGSPVRNTELNCIRHVHGRGLRPETPGSSPCHASPTSLCLCEAPNSAQAVGSVLLSLHHNAGVAH